MRRPASRWLQLANRSIFLPIGSPAALAVEGASKALTSGDRPQALRQLDRAWRLAPDHRGAIGPIYAGQLIADGNAGAAIAALRASLALDPRSDSVNLLKLALERAGRPLEGIPELFLEGRATESNGFIEGWVRDGANPDTALSVVVEDEKGHCRRLKCTPDPAGRSRQAFRFNLKRSGLKGNRLNISVLSADRGKHLLPVSPLLLGPAALVTPTPSHAATRTLPAPSRRAVDIVIPVYRNYLETVACIESVLKSRRPSGAVIVIDDASPEPPISKWLKKVAANKCITLLRNDNNLGFSASVNRGLELNPDRDVVVLNSDTLVFADWVQRLKSAAHAKSSTGSATPLTNDGSIASFPRYTVTDLSSAQAAALDQLAAKVNKGQQHDLPVGVGFCQYFKREMLNATGLLDAAVFGAGYGEEVDLCMRGQTRGFGHVLAADTFVLHRGGSSFGTRKAALMDRNHRLLTLRHPEFERLVAAHDERDPGLPIRRRLAEAQLMADRKERALVVSIPMTGGVERFVTERERALQAQGITPLVVSANKEYTNVSLRGAGASSDLKYVMPGELGALEKVVRGLRLSHVELQHFLGMPARVIDMIRALPVPMDIYVHDYVWICPQITLIDRLGKYCGEPKVSVCERCVLQKTPNLPEKIGVAALRRRSAKWLGDARRVIAPARDVAERLKKYFPDVRTEVVSWQPAPRVAPRFVPPESRVRVALLGAIGQHKGYDVLLACARDARSRDLPLEFTLVGFSQEDKPLLDTGRVFVTGAYHEVETSALLRRENPHVIFLPSVWPETWSYTLTYALETGLPIVSFDLGAIAERLRGLPRGLLLPLATRPGAINDFLLQAAMNGTR